MSRRPMRWWTNGPAALLAAIAVDVLGPPAAAQDRKPSPFEISDPKGVDDEQFLSINGADQWVTIRGRDRANPVILVVGGLGTDSPGAVASPYLGAFQGWEPYFTVVQWDMRGAGKTFAKAGNRLDPDLGVDRLMADALTLTDTLRQRLGQRKIVLLGLSFGSTLAARLAHDHPDRYSAYVAAGQIADRRVVREMTAIAYVRGLAEARGDNAALADLEVVGAHPFTETPRDPKKIEAWLRGSAPYRPRVPADQRRDVLSAPHWAVMDALAIRVGQDASEAKFGAAWAEGFDYAGLRGAYRLPVFLIQGDNDFDAPLSLSKAWLDKVRAPAKSVTVIAGAGDHAIQTDGEVYVKVLRDKVRPWAVRAR
jgi:pimeloyl-ACP methyl ester carboxylesterase